MSTVAAEERPIPPGEQEPRLVELRVGSVLWAAAAALFLLLRAWPIWAMPVGGPELLHLSGAWNASLGVDDARYVPTLFQSITAATFLVTDSEIFARILAFAATATIPVALYLLRGWLGQAGAVLALVVLAVDAPSIALGSSASAMGLDLALTAWLFVALTRGGLPLWTWAVLGALLASAGPVPLPLIAAAIVVPLLRREALDRRVLVWTAGGAIAGVIFTTLRIGAGVDGLTVAPFQLFAHGYDQDWSTADALDVVLTSSWPILAGGLVAAGWRCYQAWHSNMVPREELILLVWALFAFGWWASSSQSHTGVPVAALTLPLALLIGPALASALRAMFEADWHLARILLPVAAAAVAIIGFHIGDWAHMDRVGNASEQLVVVALAIATLAALGTLARERESRPTVLAIVLPVAAAPLLVASSVVSFRAGESPLPSPAVAPQAKNLRAVAIETAGRVGGQIVIHPDFEQQLTWPFRDSGNVIVASRVPAEAAVVIWPVDAPPPEGFTVLDGEWAFVERVEPPTGSVFELVRWYIDRYSLQVTADRAVVYVRASS